MIGKEREKNLDSSFYFHDGYFNRAQVDSLTSQLLLVHEKRPSTILEIGPGNGFVSDFLRKGGYNIKTFDINPALNPDVVGDLTKIDNYFGPKEFDLILCAEVLEHLPFSAFEGILDSFSKISKKWVILTLPNRHKNIIDLSLGLKLRNKKSWSFSRQIRIPSKGHKWEGHHWEINFDKHTTSKAIKKVLTKYFHVEKDYLEERNRYHHFFELRTI